MKEIPLTRWQVALCDDEDFDSLVQHSWYAHWSKTSQCFYAISRINGKLVRMHRWLFGLTQGKEIDHVDGNGINNQRLNLRLCSRSQNMANTRLRVNNTSGYKGVDLHQCTGKWRALIQVQHKRIHIGLFCSATEAALAYDKVASQYFGQFASTNYSLGLLSIGTGGS